MSSVLDFVDFGSTFFGQPDKQRIKRQEYLTQNVDYYKQGLESTGIKVTDPERWSDIEGEKKRKVDISQVGVTEGDGGQDQDLSTTDMANLGGGVSNALSSSSSLDAINTSFVDYNTSLQNAGFKDRSKSFLSKNFGISLAAPQSVKDVKQDIKSITAERVAKSVGKKALGLLGFNPIGTSLLSGFTSMTTVQDPLGNPSARPSHAVLGTVMDINYSIQSNNISQSIAAMNANLGVSYSQRGPVGYFGYDPTNGQLISRAPLGKTWTGTTNLSIEQLSNLEALSKGFTTNGYNNQTERGELLAMGTDTIGGQTFGGYSNNGFHHGINGSSRTGTMAQAEKAAKGYGITTKQFTNILATVRKNLTWNGKPKNSKLTLDYLSRKQFRDNESSGGSYSMGLETDVNAQQSIQDVISGKTPPGLSPSVGTSVSSSQGAVGSTGGLGGATGAGYGADSEGTDSSDSNSSDMGGMTAKGGFIGSKKNFALGGRGDAEPAGFIGGPPENYSDQTTIADDIPLTVKDGTFVLNAPAVENEGSPSIQKMLAEGYQKAMTRDIGVDKNFRIGKIPSREELDIQISRGEVVVPPHIAKAIGYDRLEKINNRGKREVERRQKAGNQEKVQAGEGFASKGGEQKVTLYRGEPSKIPKRAALLQDKYTGSWFSPNKNFTKTYGEVAKTMELTFDEYKKGAKKAFLKKNIARHMTEKEESKLPKNLTKNEKSRIFQSLKYIDYMANEVKRGNRSIKAFTDFMYEGVFPKEKDKATIMLLETANRSPKAFGKLVVDSLVKNVVSKGVPILGTVTGFAPTEMGDATLSGEEGFIYDYTPIKNPSATQ
jgi:hypothetical protein